LIKTKCITSISVIILCFQTHIYAFENTRIEGNTKSYVGWSDPVDIPLLPANKPKISLLNNLRLKLFSEPSQTSAFEFAYNISPGFKTAEISSNSDSFSNAQALPYRIKDIKRQITPSQTGPDRKGYFALFQNLDRLSITKALTFTDINIGRQAIAWGSARSVNPTDILTPFSYNSLNTEDRTGIDAIRFRTPLGNMSELDFGTVLGLEGMVKNSAAFIRSKFPINKTDISAVLVHYKTHSLLGIDIQGSILDAGFWCESAYNLIREPSTSEINEDFFRLSTGLDYNFSEINLYTSIEYHFNGAGFYNPDEYKLSTNRVAYIDGGVFLLGRNYIISSISLQITPLLSSTLSVIFNANDTSALVSPKFEYSLMQNLYADIGAMINSGNKPNSALDMDSEFGTYTTTVYASLRYYF